MAAIARNAESNPGTISEKSGSKSIPLLLRRRRLKGRPRQQPCVVVAAITATYTYSPLRSKHVPGCGSSIRRVEEPWRAELRERRRAVTDLEVARLAQEIWPLLGGEP